MASSSRSSTSRQQHGVVAKAYLLLYNIAQTVGWFILLVKTMQYVLEGRSALWKSVPELYSRISYELKIFQSLALLEVMHSFAGLVKANPMTTLAQVYSRLFVVWAVVDGVPGTCQCFGLLLAVLAWSLTEVVRYAYYAFSLLGSVPYPILWLRYSMFYFLYPTGILGELMMMFSALPTVRASHQWSLALPNICNMAFSYYYFLIFTILVYIPMTPTLIGHMINQRAKFIGGANKSKSD